MGEGDVGVLQVRGVCFCELLGSVLVGALS